MARRKTPARTVASRKPKAQEDIEVIELSEEEVEVKNPKKSNAKSTSDDRDSDEEVGPSKKARPSKKGGKTASKRKAPKKKAADTKKTKKGNEVLSDEEIEELVGDANDEPAKEDIKNDDNDSDSEVEYEVERILDMKKTKDGKRVFQVKWKGFPSSESTWEPEEHLTDCAELLKTFLNNLEKENLSRARRLTTQQSTKSSNAIDAKKRRASVDPLQRVKSGRISKSRSRTPVWQTSDTLKLPSPELPKQGKLSLQKYMRLSTERKLELLSNGATTQTTTIQEEDEVSENDATATNSTKRKWGRLSKTIGYCGAAVATVGLSLLYSHPETLNWDNVGPQFQQYIAQLQEQVFPRLGA